MTPFRWLPVLFLVACASACGGGTPDPSKVDEGTGSKAGGGAGAAGPVVGQPDSLDLDGSSSDGSAGAGPDSECGASLTGRVRDFKAAEEKGGHPDFETFKGDGASVGIVKDLLGDDKKPVYKPSGPLTSQYGQQTTGKAEFDQWYRDVEGVNIALPFTVPLTQGPGGLSSYDNAAFFPIDGEGFGNFKKTGHNFGFTFELHTEFSYNGGEVFTFTGDDDLWVFVNGHLGIDLGGLHREISESIDLDEVAQAFGLKLGQTYPLDLFHAERHTNDSHFRVETSIKFTNCDPIIIPK